MSVCIGIKVREGLVAVADTRLTAGSDVTVGRKLHTFEKQDHPMFVATSGLRSVSDKALSSFDRMMSEMRFDSMLEAIDAFSTAVRFVREEDMDSLERSGLNFNSHFLFGGQLRDDAEPRLFLVFPEANWIEIGEDTPYQAIGASAYAKPIMRRTLQFDDSLRHALAIAALALDNAALNSADVAYPMDVAVLPFGTRELATHRYEDRDMRPFSDKFQDAIRDAVENMPKEWLDRMFGQLD